MVKTNKAETGKVNFKKSRAEWDFRIAANMNSLKLWRFLALISMTGFLVVVFYVGQYIQKPKMIPYVIEVNGDQISYKGIMLSQKLSINDAVVRNYLIRFITNLRSVSSDVVNLKNNLIDTYSISSTSAQRQITEFIAQSKPFERSNKEERVDIRFTVFEKISEKTWRAEWVEEVRSKGIMKEQNAISGTFTYVQNTPTTPELAEKNPFGFFISEYFIAERK